MKIFQIAGVVFFLFFSLPDHSFSQDLLFLKDTTVLKVIIKDFDGKTVKYEIPGDSLGITYYLSKSALDSLKYVDGKSFDFTRTSGIWELPKKLITRNYLSVEMINLFTGKPNIDFERFSKTGRTGFVIGFLINFKNPKYDYWYGDPYGFEFWNYSPHQFFIKAGINFYPFNYSLASTGSFRFSHGFSVLMGSYKKADYNDYYYDGNNYVYKTNHVFAASLMWNLRERIFLDDHFQLTGGLDISLLPFFTFFCPQTGLSISF